MSFDLKNDSWYQNEPMLYQFVCSNAVNGEFYHDEPWINPIYFPRPGEDQYNGDEIDNLLALVQTEESLCLCGSDIPCNLGAQCEVCGAIFPRRRQYNAHDIRVSWVLWQCIGVHKTGGCPHAKKIIVEEKDDDTKSDDEDSKSPGRVKRKMDEELFSAQSKRPRMTSTD